MRSLFVPFMFAEEFRKTQLHEIELKSNPSGKKRGHEGAGEAAEEKQIGEAGRVEGAVKDEEQLNGKEEE